MKKAGKFYKDKEKALEEVRRKNHQKNNKYKEDRFLCMIFKEGYMVLSKQQFSELKK